MLQDFLAPEYFPFTLAIGLFFSLLLLELVLLMLGGSMMGGDTDADVDIDADFDIDADLDFDADLVDLDLDALDGDLDAAEAIEPEGGSSLFSWLGIGDLPVVIWLGTMFLSFGVIGIGLQLGLSQSIGLTLNALLAAIPAAFGANWFTRKFGRLFARAIPKLETESVSERHLGRRKGVVSQGTAARGRPAEVRVTDRHGNIQYLRAEPFRDDQEIAPGTEVIVMRHSRDGGYRIVSLDHFEQK